MQWFGYVERMEEECLVKRITRADVIGLKARGRPHMGYLSSVKRALGEKRMSMELGRVIVK